MIFVTVGTQLPFTRLTRAVDAWCARSGRGAEVFGQIGALAPGDHRPRAFAWVDRLTPDDVDARIAEARLVIAHAGMGTIIAALDSGTPILILPRRAALGEHRNAHQIATARRMADRPGVIVAATAEDIPALIDAGLEGAGSQAAAAPPPFAEDRLIAALRQVIRPG